MRGYEITSSEMSKSGVWYRGRGPSPYPLLSLALSLGCQTRPQGERPAPTLAATTSTPADSTAGTTAPPTSAPSSPSIATSAPSRPSAAPSLNAVAAPPPPGPSPSGALSPKAVSTLATSQTPCRVGLVGDSLTDVRGGGGGYVRYLEKHCPKSSFTNYAKGGAMVNQMRRHFEAVVLAEPPGSFTHLVFFGGVNDLYSDETAGRTPAKVETDLTSMITAGKERGARVVVLTVAPWGGFTKYFNPKRSAATRELNSWVLTQAAMNTIDVAIDAFSLLSCGDAEKLCPDYEPPFHDGLHFGPKGHEKLGQALYEAEFARCP